MLASLLALALAAPAFCQTEELRDIKVAKFEATSKAPAQAAAWTRDFMSGVNYPWNEYGSDFGSSAWGHLGVSKPANRAAVAADFAYLASKGVKVVRWFLFCDGRAAFLTDDKGMITGLNPMVEKDLEAALDIAQGNGMKLIFSIFDFHMLDEGKRVDGVLTGGRAYLITDAQAQDSLFANALEPLLKKYGGNSAVLAWEVMNEPELRTKGGLNPFVNRPVGYDGMYAFAKRVVSAIHAGGGKATLGSYRKGDVAQWRGLGLDLYQFHYYDYMSWRFGEDLNAPYADLGLDQPCILGEFPTKGAKFPVDSYMGTVRGQGYAGALAWSLKAKDQYSDFKSAADRFAAFASSR